MPVKKIGANPLDEMLSEGLNKPEVVEKTEVAVPSDAPVLRKEKRTYKRRKMKKSADSFELHSFYCEPEMWKEMKWLSRRVGVNTRSALIRMLISRLSTRVRGADHARETAEKNVPGTLTNPLPAKDSP